LPSFCFGKQRLSGKAEADFDAGDDHLHGNSRDHQSGQPDERTGHMRSGEEKIDASGTNHQWTIPVFSDYFP
jgi:hypothetical protein